MKELSMICLFAVDASGSQSTMLHLAQCSQERVSIDTYIYVYVYRVYTGKRGFFPVEILISKNNCKIITWMKFFFCLESFLKKSYLLTILLNIEVSSFSKLSEFVCLEKINR